MKNALLRRFLVGACGPDKLQEGGTSGKSAPALRRVHFTEKVAPRIHSAGKDAFGAFWCNYYDLDLSPECVRASEPGLAGW